MAQFVGSPVMNIVPVAVAGGEATASVGVGGGQAFDFPAELRGRIDAALPAGHELVMGVRPEAVLVARDEAPGLRPLEAHFIEPLGAYDIVDLKVGERYLKARTASGFVRNRGDRVWARLDAGQVHFFDATSGDSLDIRLDHA